MTGEGGKDHVTSQLMSDQRDNVSGLSAAVPGGV